MFGDQKAQEISLALIKISVYIRRAELRGRLEKLSFELLEAVSSRDYFHISRITAVIENLVRFGKTIYEIETVNADIVLQELGNLNSAIRQIAELSLPDLENVPQSKPIFSRNADITEQIVDSKKSANSGKHKAKAKKADTDIKESRKDNAAIKSAIGESRNPANDNSSDDNPATRQSAIVEKIRQFGNSQVQLREIIAAFPDFSERTLRYDLQRLCNQGIVERIGVGGPGTYYKVRDI